MKNFFAEFKKFITRGNVMDMAVGVIVGGAFTAIVNGLSNFILKPLINYLLALILGKDTLAGIHTMLLEAYTTDETGAQVLILALLYEMPVATIAKTLRIKETTAHMRLKRGKAVLAATLRKEKRP